MASRMAGLNGLTGSGLDCRVDEFGAVNFTVCGQLQFLSLSSTYFTVHVLFTLRIIFLAYDDYIQVAGWGMQKVITQLILLGVNAQIRAIPRARHLHSK